MPVIITEVEVEAAPAAAPAAPADQAAPAAPATLDVRDLIRHLEDRAERVEAG